MPAFLSTTYTEVPGRGKNPPSFEAGASGYKVDPGGSATLGDRLYTVSTRQLDPPAGALADEEKAQAQAPRRAEGFSVSALLAFLCGIAVGAAALAAAQVLIVGRGRRLVSPEPPAGSPRALPFEATWTPREREEPSPADLVLVERLQGLVESGEASIVDARSTAFSRGVPNEVLRHCFPYIEGCHERHVQPPLPRFR